VKVAAVAVAVEEEEEVVVVAPVANLTKVELAAVSSGRRFHRKPTVPAQK
jgi:hypothetical protein